MASSTHRLLCLPRMSFLMLPLNSVATRLVCGSLACFAPAHVLSVQLMARYLSPIPLRCLLIPHVLLIALALFLTMLNHKRGATQSAQEKTPEETHSARVYCSLGMSEHRPFFNPRSQSPSNRQPPCLIQLPGSWSCLDNPICFCEHEMPDTGLALCDRGHTGLLWGALPTATGSRRG